MPDVTVIIPVYNSGATLPRAVASLRAQTLTTFDVLIVDDGSTDDSLEIAKREAAADPRIDVIEVDRNRGKPHAMNLATARATGRWIAVLDADDRFAPERLQRLIMEGDASGVDLVADNQIHRDHLTDRIVRYAFSTNGAPARVGLDELLAHSNPGAPFDFGILKPVLRRTFVERHALAYFPTARFAEDFYYLLDAFAVGGKGLLLSDPLYDWTLPFSSEAREWSRTGRGAWRYDYRNAQETNRAYLDKYASGDPRIRKLLAKRAKDYKVMVRYLDAQRLLEEDKRPAQAAAIIARSPGTWPLLLKRVLGRFGRSASASRSTS